MNKFTTVKKHDIKKLEDEKKSVIFKGENIEVIKKNKEFITSKDKIAVLPFFIEDGYIYLSVENVDSYEYKTKKDRYLDIIEGDYDSNSTASQNVRNTLFNKCGVVLSEFYQIEAEGPFFASKNNTMQYYTCLLELKYNDYKQSMIKEENKIIKLDISNIDNINIYDMTMLYLLSKLKNNYKI